MSRTVTTPATATAHPRRRLMTAAALVLLSASATGTATAAESDCQHGVFCAWAEEDYRGAIHRVDQGATPLEHCVSLPPGLEASSFVNNTGHPVTVYQDGKCATQADFKTYPSGTFVPKALYMARAIKVWRH